MADNYYILRSIAAGGNQITLSLPAGLVTPGMVKGNIIIICIKAGGREITAIIRKLHTGSEILISEKGLQKLGLPSDIKLQAMVSPGCLHLGPVIGVFVGKGYFKLQNSTHFRLQGFVEGNRRTHTLLYLFSLRDLNWEKKGIVGTYYNYAEERWLQHFFPFPDVLYDRGGGFAPRAEKRAAKMRQLLHKMPGLERINCQHTFDKWELYQALYKYRDVKEFLPKTLFYNSQNLQRLFQDNKVIYIKPCSGSNGRGVIRVVKEIIGYTMTFYSHTQVERKIISLSHLEEEIRRIIGTAGAIVQQGLDLLIYKGSIVGLRPLVQKNGNGQWQVTAIPVRVGVKDSPITSTRTGSTVCDFPYFFEGLLGYSKEQSQDLKDRITELLGKIVGHLEEEFGTFGELGIDLALDKDGKLWFIEANAKPGKDTIALGCRQEVFIESFVTPLEYAKFLAGFKTSSPAGDLLLPSSEKEGITYRVGSISNLFAARRTITAVDRIQMAANRG